MNTKKKLLILCGIILVSVGLIYGANSVKAKILSNDKSITEDTNKKEDVSKKEDINQKETTEKIEEKSEVVNNEDNSTNNETITTEENKEQSEEKVPVETKTDEVQTPKEETPVVEEKNKTLVNIEIIDEAKNSFSNKNFSIEFTEGESLNDVMKRFLPQYASDYKMVNGYLSKLYGLKEKENGPYSGWIVYVNGVKSPVGMNDIILKNGDNITWKYVVDGVNY